MYKSFLPSLREKARNAATRWLVGSALLLAAAGISAAQGIDLSGAGIAPTAPRQHMEQLTGSVQIHAGKAEWVDLRFRVEPGMHVNSHQPHDETLIPTDLRFNGAPAARVLGQQYPAGTPLHLDIGSGETLSTYQGEFVVRAQVLATAPAGVLEGVLRYQACDARSCFPPRSLPVHVEFSAR